MAANLIVSSRTTKANNNLMTTNVPTTTSDGEPLAELSAQGFAVSLHNDSRLGLTITLDDLELYSVEGLNADALRATMTLATWQCLKGLVVSGVVDQALAAVG
jgi:hypothetical protein